MLAYSIVLFVISLFIGAALSAFGIIFASIALKIASLFFKD